MLNKYRAFFSYLILLFVKCKYLKISNQTIVHKYILFHNDLFKTHLQSRSSQLIIHDILFDFIALYFTQSSPNCLF